MKLLDLLSVDCIRAPLESTSKQGVIDELVDLLAADNRVKSASALKEAVWTREQTRTTGIGHGLAIPHGKCEGMNNLAIAIGKPAQPMDFEAIDEQPVSLIVLLASPPDRTSEHIQALADEPVTAQECRVALAGGENLYAIGIKPRTHASACREIVQPFADIFADQKITEQDHDPSPAPFPVHCNLPKRRVQTHVPRHFRRIGNPAGRWRTRPTVRAIKQEPGGPLNPASAPHRRKPHQSSPIPRFVCRRTATHDR